MSVNSFLSRIFGRDTNEDKTRIDSAEEIETRRSRRGEPEEGRQRRGFTVERAAEMIDGLPSDVPRESAVRIVRGTLAVAGIEISDLDRSIRARVSKLNSEIEFARNRQKELREKTDEVVRSLEEEIRKARETCEVGIAEEEGLISRMSKSQENIERVRAFFGFPEVEEEPAEPPAEEEQVEDETQVMDSFDADKTRVMRRPDSPFDTGRPADTTSENPTYRNPY
ncbi:MAG TPA: hypothetical protein VFE09_03765, partial [Rubrobacteraceae bacterium]|nr:hypothetical protein [Rubrobacteraceae bacterium]